MKIVILDGHAENPGDLSWEGIGSMGDLTVYERTAEEQIEERIGDARAVLTNKTPITEETMRKCPNLEYVGVLATGVNVVDLEAARERGITVTNVPAYSTDSVAQLTMALLLELCHHVGAHSDAVKAGEWSRCPDFCFWNYPLVELAGKKMGIIGFGRIGQAVARLAKAFGMEVLAYGHHGIRGELLEEGMRGVSLEELYAQADVVSLHCPLTEENRGMICLESIEKMKPGVFILNTARGPLINEEDLREGILSKRVGGAAVDVAVREPIPADSPLLTAPNLIITPHIAWAPREARERLMNTAVENLRAYLAGDPVNVVNK